MATALIIAAAVLLILLAVGHVFFWMMIIRKDKSTAPTPNSGEAVWDEYKHRYREGREVVFASPHEDWYLTSRDGLRLHALWYPAAAPSRNTLLFAHGYIARCTTDGMIFSSFYHDMGFNILFVDDRAHGDSEGRYIGFGCLDRLDITDWCKRLVAEQGEDCSIMLHGVSMGAAGVLSATGEDDLPVQVRCVLADCGFTSVWDTFSCNIRSIYKLPPFPILNFAELWCRLLAGYSFREHTPLQQIAKARIPVLIIHGAKDNFVPTRMAQPLYDACPTEKELYICPGAGHATSILADTAEYERRVRAFADKHMAAAQAVGR